MARFASLTDWLRWQETLHPREIDLGLERVAEVGMRLGLTKPKATVITVAGTNGKGSCVRALQAMLLADGATVGSYTSPHIHRYNERITVNGTAVADAGLIDAFTAIDRARREVSLSYFEFATLAALFLFQRAQCAYWLLEVGLGGRLDATNLIDPDLAIITSIGLDHCAWLGDTREAIGREKAGICRPQAPLVCADPEPPASIAQTVQSLGCDAYFFNADFGYRMLDEGCECYWRERTVARRAAPVQTQLALPSVAAAIQALALLAPTVATARLQGLRGVSLAGRMQCLHAKGRPWVLDVAHNGAAFQYLWQRLAASFTQQSWIVVIAMMRDKDIPACIEACIPYVERWITVPLEGNDRALPATDLALAIRQKSGCPVDVAASFADGLARAGQLAGTAAVLVTGSFFTVAQGLQLLAPTVPDPALVD